MDTAYTFDCQDNIFIVNLSKLPKDTLFHHLVEVASDCNDADGIWALDAEWFLIRPAIQYLAAVGAVELTDTSINFNCSYSAIVAGLDFLLINVELHPVACAALEKFRVTFTRAQLKGFAPLSVKPFIFPKKDPPSVHIDETNLLTWKFLFSKGDNILLAGPTVLGSNQRGIVRDPSAEIFLYDMSPSDADVVIRRLIAAIFNPQEDSLANLRYRCTCQYTAGLEAIKREVLIYPDCIILRENFYRPIFTVKINLAIHPSMASILQQYPVDAYGIGYNGQMLFSPRAAFALINGYNTVNPQVREANDLLFCRELGIQIHDPACDERSYTKVRQVYAQKDPLLRRLTDTGLVEAIVGIVGLAPGLFSGKADREIVKSWEDLNEFGCYEYKSPEIRVNTWYDSFYAVLGADSFLD